MFRKAAGLKNAPSQYVAVLANPPASTRSKNENLSTKSCSHSLRGHDPGGAEGPTRVSHGSGTVKVRREIERWMSCGDSISTSPVDEEQRAERRDCSGKNKWSYSPGTSCCLKHGDVSMGSTIFCLVSFSFLFQGIGLLVLGCEKFQIGHRLLAKSFFAFIKQINCSIANLEIVNDGLKTFTHP